MLDSKVLQFLKCPISDSKLAPASQDLVGWINQSIQSQTCKNMGGDMVEHQIDSALVNENQSYAIPIRAGVISLAANRLISIQDYSG